MTKDYTIREGQFQNRRLSSLTKEEMGKLLNSAPKNIGAEAGIKLMQYILKKRGAAAVVEFVVWGDNILSEVGDIEQRHFTPDTNAGEPSLSSEEKDMLEAAKPRFFMRRQFLLSTLPYGLLTIIGMGEYILRLLEQGYELTRTAPDPGMKSAPAETQPEEESDTRPSNPFAPARESMSEVSALPLLGVYAAIAGLRDFFQALKERDEEKFDQITSAVDWATNIMGIGKATPTYRLPEKKGARGR